LRLFGRRKPLHRRLAEAGGVPLDSAPPGAADDRPRGAPAEPPGWHGEQRGEPGIHGVPRARRWDAVVTAELPGVDGSERQFAALPDGSVVGEGAGLETLAAALEGAIDPPYRAEAVRRSADRWAVAASRMRVEAVPGLEGEEAELVVRDGSRTLTVDGRPRFGSTPALEQIAAGEGADAVVRARRLRGDLWEVEAAAL
jgi:hypothetical protein